jgi:alpha-L-fucosidase
MKKLYMFLGAVVISTCLQSFAGAPDSAIDQWRARRFGMFIHWGPVSLTGKEISWSRGKQTPIDVYDNLCKSFNPTNFNAEAWVKIAKDAGMQYMVLTTKHHDGFCLWPSKYTEYDIAATPYAKDIVKALADACHREGIGFGAYYSTCDWHHPDFPRGSPGGQTRKTNSNLPRYADYLRNQVSELIQNYGPLCTVWFDLPQGMSARYGIPTEKILRKLQPDIVINDRIYSARTKNGIADYDTQIAHNTVYSIIIFIKAWFLLGLYI